MSSIVQDALFFRVQDQIHQWYGLDAAERSNAIPQLVRDVIDTVKAYEILNTQEAASLAAHDGPEAA